ncbi:uncharacterized protein LOC124271975 [Haliotis rubra]|uniref:uncharacterized protein LOC124271975 n=1 Tax=Haliotis rubra TaxID=36100 RepID=UPI001EE4F404|nr:uncharacterized protein LOC124271975 [Haliotis rubra]
MMSTKLLLLVTLSCLAAVTAHGTFCCMSGTWSATMSDIQVIASGQHITSDYYYDSYHLTVAIQYYDFGTSTRKRVFRNRVVTDYAKRVRYYIAADGTCTKGNITETMLPNCIPVTSTYLGTSYIGTKKNGVKYDSWQIALAGLNATVSYTNPDCILVGMAVVGTPTVPVNQALFFSGYKLGIQNPSVFDVPISCYRPRPRPI